MIITLIVAFAACTEELAEPPVIKAFVNNVEVGNDAVAVAGGEIVNYRFEISANATIADIKLITWDVLSPAVKTPSQNLVGGLTKTLNEVVKGSFVARDDAEYQLIVKDLDGNEATESFTISVQ